MPLRGWGVGVDLHIVGAEVMVDLLLELTSDLTSINFFKSALKTYLYCKAFRH
jgi:hypothetical protein